MLTPPSVCNTACSREPSIQSLMKIALAALGFLLLTSCSAIRLGYNNADVFVRWTVQEYFDLQGGQETEFRARLARFHTWHRDEELPRYEALLRVASQRFGDGLTGEDIQWATDTVRERYHLLLKRAAGDAPPVLVTLTAPQLDHLEKQFADDNRKFAKEQFIGNEEKQRKDRLKRMRENLADWLGALSPAQEDMIAAMIRGGPSLSAYRLEERRAGQAMFMEILRSQHDPGLLAQRLTEMIDTIDSRRSPAYQRALREYEAALRTLLMNLDKTLTPAQHDHVIQHFADLAKDFHNLSQKGRQPSTASARTAG